MGEQISRLMDGDLDDAAAEAALRELKRPESIESWVCYHVIGDALRRTIDPMPGFAARFAARLAAEPTVLAPLSRQSNRLPFAWAVAATVAAATVVGWVAVSTLDPQPTALARAREAATVRSDQGGPQLVSQDYVLAHQEYSPTTQIQGLGQYLRSVSASAPERP
ncbi:MAG TPA: RseA family anti-sigma factor [Casimicrobiaceae bacterium]|nr:RseA family anti-sigma factor [Casimicrobiaceae bacterium]